MQTAINEGTSKSLATRRTISKPTIRRSLTTSGRGNALHACADSAGLISANCCGMSAQSFLNPSHGSVRSAEQPLSARISSQQIVPARCEEAASIDQRMLGMNSKFPDRSAPMSRWKKDAAQ